jgi:hypothetical protein
MGQASPYPSGGQNFAEIARHYIALIYLVGLFEVLLVVMFPPFFIALLFGLRHRLTRSSALMLWVVGGYLLLIYYSHVSRDFIQSRFLFAPALLLYPWVGLGMERLWARWCAGGSAKWRCVLFAGLFFVPALFEAGAMVADRDPSLAAAGRWVKGQEAFRGSRLFFDDSRAAFHAGQSWQEFQRNHRRWRKAGTAIEDFALANDFEILVLLSRSGKKKASRPVQPPFVRRMAFAGHRYAVQVYTLPGVGAPGEAAGGGPPVRP